MTISQETLSLLSPSCLRENSTSIEDKRFWRETWKWDMTTLLMQLSELLTSTTRETSTPLIFPHSSRIMGTMLQRKNCLLSLEESTLMAMLNFPTQNSQTLSELKSQDLQPLRNWEGLTLLRELLQEILVHLLMDLHWRISQHTNLQRDHTLLMEEEETLSESLHLHSANLAWALSRSLKLQFLEHLLQ